MEMLTEKQEIETDGGYFNHGTIDHDKIQSRLENGRCVVFPEAPESLVEECYGYSEKGYKCLYEQRIPGVYFFAIIPKLKTEV
jgi:hypothetical protein